MKKKFITALLVAAMTMTAFAGCGSSKEASDDVAATDESAAADEATGEKTLVYGDTTFNAENGENGLNPHDSYSGWACIRYGVGETLFKYSDEMTLEPWLATGYEMVDETTWKVTLRDDVDFSSGRHMDAAAVKECLDDLLDVHDRAPSDLKIDSIEASGDYELTIKTSEPVPALMNYLCDPYGCIIDMEAGVSDDQNVSATGPYVADSVSEGLLELSKNENYYGTTPGVDHITVKTITDGDTMTMALQSGEIDMAYGLPYSSIELFSGDDYNISSCATSRAFFAWMNFESPIASDPAVRKAIAYGINKQDFVDVLLLGNGYAASGVFPSSFPYGNEAVTTEAYDAEAAKKTLEDAGWIDTDGDGIREKDGTRLTINWLTYPSRQELPLLAESAQATLKDIGMEVNVNSTADHNDIITDMSAWDVYASAMVTAPTGDPEYFFTSCCETGASQNKGHYSNAYLDELIGKMRTTFDTANREMLAVKMQQEILDDNAYVFCSHLQMNYVSRANVTGFTAHTCDYYEITPELTVE